MALTLEGIDRFIGQGNPLAQAGGAQTLVRATGGSLTGAAFLAALARKESSFGAKAFAPNNFWGYGVHLGPDVNTAPSVEAMAARVWKGLSGSLYQGAGLTTPRAIIARYAPSSENDTGLYQSQVEQWFQQLGLSPTTNIFSGATVPVAPATPMPAGASPALSRPKARAAQLAAGTGFQIPPALQGRIANYIAGSRADVLSGRAPRDVMPIFTELNGIAASAAAMPRGVPAPVTDFRGRTRAAATPPGAFPGAPGSGTYGFKTGSVDSGLAVAGGEGGDWGGSMERALALAKAVGATPSSQKRSRRLTASGNPSDHWTGSTQSYATDLPTSGKAGDALLAKLQAVLGVPLKAGTWNNINIGGYRYQVGWRTPGHFDHIHVGVKKL